jgi:hypothetical protein
VIKDANYILPHQCAQLLDAFSKAEMFDMDFFSIIEHILVEQIDLATGAHLIAAFQAHALWS